MNEWISVKDELPMPYTEVLTYRKSLSYGGGYIKLDHLFYSQYDSGLVWCDDLNTWKSSVTHWMPLPEPPKED